MTLACSERWACEAWQTKLATHTPFLPQSVPHVSIRLEFIDPNAKRLQWPKMAMNGSNSSTARIWMAASPRFGTTLKRDNFANTFWVENGVLKVGYEGYPEFNFRKSWRLPLRENRTVIDRTVLTRGSISLQSESHPVEFHRVEFLDLSAK